MSPGGALTPRGRLALALGCLTYLAAWAFGSKPLYPVALGLFAAVLLSRLWTRLAGRPTELRRRLPGGDRFSGDFVVAHLSPSGHRLEIVLVDVSGKGTRAGTRSLLLSGALGGLLGAVPSADFLRAANEYLERQGWEEGFATAVHLDLDLRTGEYSIANAGHPSPALFVSGRALWTVLDGARGPLLGVVPGAAFPRQTGRLGRGDALLFYSDGVIEARGRDLVDGIDRMLGVASMSVLGQGDVARDVCESARSGEDDDRAALAVRRL